MKEILDNYKPEINKSSIMNDLAIEKHKYILASIHREENLDLDKNFKSIIESINYIADQVNACNFLNSPKDKKK